MNSTPDELSRSSSTRAPSGLEMFAQLPLELQARIWELACPGPRLIEVYPRPRAWFFGQPRGYRWQAHRCQCERKCHSPFVIAQVCRESRRIFKRVGGEYAQCFGTQINWARDILYIGDRTGHLHNTEFLKAVELGGGLGKVKNLAVHEDVWAETRNTHGDSSVEFKRCGPVGVVQQLGVEHLTIVGKAGFFRDGTEFWNEIDEREWLWNSDTEADDYDEYLARMRMLEEIEEDSQDEEAPDEPQIGSEAHDGPSNSPTYSQPTSTSGADGQSLRIRHSQADIVVHSHSTAENEDGNRSENRPEDDAQDVASNESENEQADLEYSSTSSEDLFLDPADVVDRWHCDAPTMVQDPRVYKPRWPDSRLEQHGIPNGDSGLALVNFDSIPGSPLWINGSKNFRSAATIKSEYFADFEEAKWPQVQHYDDENDPASDNYIDWLAWTPPTLDLAFLRRTGQSCYVEDWKGLEQHYISWKEANRAKRHTAKYIDEAVRKGYYRREDVQHIKFDSEYGAMEGYGAVEAYVANGMEIPCTATTKVGVAYAKGNYFNTTKRLYPTSVYESESEFC